jgi:alpha-tubulin suppressor-like RCC1 family protein
MPKDDINYKFTENGIVYDFYDVFVPAENFRQPALWTWGNGDLGMLGTNDTITRSTPVTTFAGGTTWKSVAYGDGHMAALKTDGSLWTWGFDNSAQLGTNASGNRSTPVTTFAGGNTWKQVSCGNSRTAAIKTDGSLWVWGANSYGTLGTNDTTRRSTPVTTFAGGNNWKQVSCGYEHTAAIKTDGTLWVWGRNNNAVLGDNTTTQRNIPVTTFAGGNDWKSVDSIANHTAAIKTDGSLWIWGQQDDGRLGTNDTTPKSTPVTTFAGGNNWKQVSCGFRYTAAIKTDGSLWTWGLSDGGFLGNNNPPTQVIPTPVTTFAGGTNWKSVNSGTSHTLAIKTDGSLWVWGAANSGQLGNNVITNFYATPVTTFAGGNNWKFATGGAGRSAAIKYSPDP